MTSKEQQRIAIVTFIISLICVLVLIMVDVQLLSFNGIKTAFSISTIIILWWTFYFNSGWKIPLIRKILYKENINGTWFGMYESGPIESEEPTYKGEISLVIKQSYLYIDITSSTEKYTNYSYSEVLTHSKKSKRTKLVYVYAQEEISAKDHNIRRGTSELDLTLSKDKDSLYGKFWTNGGTLGQLKLTRVSKNHLVQFEDARKKAQEGEK
jgi:hypothetical protein